MIKKYDFKVEVEFREEEFVLEKQGSDKRRKNLANKRLKRKRNDK